MKKILSTSYTEGAFHVSALLLRVIFSAFLFLKYGIQKLMKFSDLQRNFYDPFHVGHRWSLMMVLFAEIVCAVLLILGLFSRLAAFVIVINLAVAVFLFQKGHPVMQSELSIIYLTAFFVCLLLGPGKYSVDAALGR